MERVDLETFGREPVGRFVAGRTWAHFCAHGSLFGVVLFGRPDRAECSDLVRSLRVELGGKAGPHGSIVDASRLEGADEGAFEELSAYVQAEHAALATRVERLVLVRPRGLGGAVVAGFFGVLDAPYPVTVASDARTGLALLGESEDLALELEKMVATAAGTEPAVVVLRGYLAEHFLEADVEGACAALSVSERTLQRRLGEAGTTFRQELLAARLREAERRLRSTRDPLTSVAIDCGFASLQHFSSKFHDAYGVSPSAWRERAKPAG